jgi:hypothetical protein
MIIPSILADLDYRLVIYSFAFLAMAGLALRQASRPWAGKQKMGMRMAGLGLLGQGLIFAAAAPTSTLLTAWLWTGVTAASVGRPIDVLRVVCGLAVVAGLVLYWRGRKPLSIKFGWMRQAVFPVTCLVLVAIGWIAVDRRERTVETTIAVEMAERQSAAVGETGRLALIEYDRESPARDSAAWDHAVSQRQRKGAIFLACIAAVVIVLVAVAARQSPGQRSRLGSP